MKLQAMALTLMVGGMAAFGATSADQSKIDPAHSGVNFHVLHNDISWIPGRFNKFSGEILIDHASPVRSSVRMTIDTGSIDTNNEKRDTHLRSDHFFDATKYPTMEFVSNAVEATSEGYRVTGELNLHGQTRPFSFLLRGGARVGLNKNKKPCTGYTTQFKVKRSDFGIGQSFPYNFISDEILVTITLETEKLEK